jgi:lipoprotein-releasing system permease protein
MDWPYELQVGWRYTRAGRSGRRNRFISFISAASMAGIALGVAALIIVLSVMNGFRKEVRDRMLSVVSHIEVAGVGGAALADWQKTAADVRRHPQVEGVAPFVAEQALIARGDEMKGVLVRGILPAEEAKVTELAVTARGVLARLTPDSSNIVLGVELAKALHVKAGEKVSLILPGGDDTAAGVVPRMGLLTVAGTFDAGHFEYDNGLALVHLDEAMKLFQLSGPNGLRLRLKDLEQAPRVAAELEYALGPQVVVHDWTQTNRNWFASVQIQKRLLSIILTLIVAVAAFNLVSTLVMTVTDKRADIAILRTLGATPRSVMGIFMVQGAASGVIGTLVGVLLGLGVAYNIDVIVPAIERLLHVSFLPGSIYLISRMPSDPQQGDIVPIALVSLVLSFLATLYPSWRASRLQPAEALRYE